ncbi:MAG: HAD family phosphatase, partial [Muribaculaceae bacterium]|nr:HAD family phosphatase [Muribaculaceae bacterium]
MIKNVLLDLGGVIMDIKRQNCVDAFTALGMKDADSFFTDAKQKGPFLALECGQITPAEFHNEIRTMLPEEVTDEQIDTALDRFLIGIPAERLRQLDDLRSDYKVYMLSNTNRIMWDTFIVPQFKQLGKTMEDYFDGIVTSFDAGVCKPDADIYRYAI